MGKKKEVPLKKDTKIAVAATPPPAPIFVQNTSDHTEPKEFPKPHVKPPQDAPKEAPKAEKPNELAVGTKVLFGKFKNPGTISGLHPVFGYSIKPDDGSAEAFYMPEELTEA